MKKITRLVFVIFLVISSAYVFVASDWKIKDNYTIKFISNHPSGLLKGLKGTIKFDEKDLPNSKFDVSVDVNTIDTDNLLMNSHAVNDSWFDVEKFPVIKFTSSEILKTASSFQANGVLEMHGIKKDISIPFTYTKNGNDAEFLGNFEVNRTDFKIGKPGGKVPDVMKIEIILPVEIK